MSKQLIDIGEHCIDCGDSVAQGSGKYVNRIPADDGEKSGFLCADCQCEPCDRCGLADPELQTIEDDTGAIHVCDDCLTPEEVEAMENE